jgi:hypothetical protein
MGSVGIEPFQVRQGCMLRMVLPRLIGLQTTFAVPLHCDSCVADVKGALEKVEGTVPAS